MATLALSSSFALSVRVRRGGSKAPGLVVDVSESGVCSADVLWTLGPFKRLSHRPLSWQVVLPLNA